MLDSEGNILWSREFEYDSEGRLNIYDELLEQTFPDMDKKLTKLAKLFLNHIQQVCGPKMKYIQSY